MAERLCGPVVEGLAAPLPKDDASAPGDSRPAARILPLRLEGVCYDVDGQQLVHDLSCEIPAGARALVLGPNGAGKSLTLRLCHGLLAPTAGRVRWLGPLGAQGGKAVRERQAMVFQRPVLLRRSALANVTYALALHHVPRAERRERAMAALEETGLARLAGRPALVLSAGEQQRLALARAWALRPEVLFLDEPTASLDPAATQSVERIIQAIHAAGATIVMTTHDLPQARRLADRVLFLHRGRLVESAPADEFYEAPTTPEARAFLRGELRW